MGKSTRSKRTKTLEGNDGTNKKLGRPSVFTKEVIDDIAEFIKLGMSFDRAARGANINPATFFRHKQNAIRLFQGEPDPAWDEEYVEILNYFIETTSKADVEGEIEMARHLRNAAPSDWRAAAHVLERRYGWRKQVEAVDKPRDVLADAKREAIDVSKLSIAELEEYASSLGHIAIEEAEILDIEEE